MAYVPLRTGERSEHSESHSFCCHKPAFRKLLISLRCKYLLPPSPDELATPKPQRIAKYHEKEVQGGHISIFVGICFTVNYLMGSGFLGVPQAFAKSGYVFGSVLMLMSFTLLRCTCVLELDAMARAEALISHKLDPVKYRSPDFHISQRKFEINELVGMFLGDTAKRIHIFVLCLYFYGGMWMYANIFASSLASHLSVPFLNNGNSCDIYGTPTTSCYSLYYFWLSVFALVGVSVSAFNLKEQVYFQVCMTVGRFLVIGIMATTSIAGLYSSPQSRPFGKHSSSDPGTLPMLDWSGISTLLPVALYSQMCQSAVPFLSQPVKEKERLPLMFSASMFITTMLYTILGLSASLYFGYYVQPSINLEWDDYLGTCNNGCWWASAISYTVVLFPAIDCLTVYPLNSICLGNNLMAAAYGSDNVAKMERRPVVRYLYICAIAAVPPIIAAAIIPNLATAINITGTIAIPLVIVLPCWLQRKAHEQCQLVWPQLYTEEGNWLHSPYSDTLLCNRKCTFMMELLGWSLFVVVCFFTIKG